MITLIGKGRIEFHSEESITYEMGADGLGGVWRKYLHSIDVEYGKALFDNKHGVDRFNREFKVGYLSLMCHLHGSMNGMCQFIGFVLFGTWPHWEDKLKKVFPNFETCGFEGSVVPTACYIKDKWIGNSKFSPHLFATGCGDKRVLYNILLPQYEYADEALEILGEFEYETPGWLLADAVSDRLGENEFVMALRSL